MNARIKLKKYGRINSIGFLKLVHTNGKHNLFTMRIYHTGKDFQLLKQVSNEICEVLSKYYDVEVK